MKAVMQKPKRVCDRYRLLSPNPNIYTLSHCSNYFFSVSEKGGFVLEFKENYLAWNNPGIGRYLIFMAWEGLFFFCLVLVIEFGVLRRLVLWLKNCSLTMKPINYDELSFSTSEQDDDVFAEKRRVAVGANNDDVLLIRELTKVYPGRRG